MREECTDRIGDGAQRWRGSLGHASGAARAADTEIPVKVDFIGNTVDARTGTIELRATFENPDLRLVPGELVDVTVRLETLTQTVFVPREAVNVGQAGTYVFVIDDDNKAQMRPVQVLYRTQTIAALGSGVEARRTRGDRRPIAPVARYIRCPSSETRQAQPRHEAPARPECSETPPRPQAADPPATAQRGSEGAARGG